MATKKVLVKGVKDLEIPSTSDLVNMNTNVSIPTGSSLTTNTITSQAASSLIVNGLSALNLQHNSTTYLSTSSTALTLQNAPLISVARYLTGSATLTSTDRFVILQPAGTTNLTLPTAPPDGTVIEIFCYTTVTNDIAILRGGSTDTIVTSTATSIDLGFSGSSVKFYYDATHTRWWILNFKHNRVYFTWNSASANDYLQSNSTGGALSTAFPIMCNAGVTYTHSIRIRARSSVSGDHTVKLRTTNFATGTDLTTNFTSTILSGNATASYGVINNLVTQPASSTGSTLSFVLQATTAITTAIEGYIEYFTL